MKKLGTVRCLAASVLIWVAGPGFVGLAQAADAPANARAARLTYMQGAVTVETADAPGSQPAQMNLPLLAGVRLATGEDGQAEVEFEDGSLVRLTPNSTLSLDNLTVEPGIAGRPGVFTTGLSLVRGLAYVELRATAQYRYTLDAGGDVLSPVENTTVRVNFDEPPAVFAVLDGTARVARMSGENGAGYQREVRAGESLREEANDPTRYDLTQEIANDTWDTWNDDLDRAAVTEAASRTVARDGFAGAQGYGWSDLDANGSWYDVPGQGQIWQPEVAAIDAGFDPYGNGTWAYSGAGYVWASGYAWGWTPYRCGNWSYFGGFGWGWAPGSSCGALGWGFAGGGRPVNILIGPNGYRVPHVPARPPHGGPVRPILPVRSVAGASLPADVFAQGGFRARAGSVPRVINGATVTPLEPLGALYTPRGGEAPHSALQRDFPVEAASHAAIVGRESTQPAVVHSNMGWRSTGVRSAPLPAYQGQSTAPAYRSPGSRNGTVIGQTAPVPRSAPVPSAATGTAATGTSPAQKPVYAPQAQRPVYSPPMQRPMYAPTPVQRSAPAPAPAPRAAPAAAPHVSPK